MGSFSELPADTDHEFHPQIQNPRKGADLVKDPEMEAAIVAKLWKNYYNSRRSIEARNAIAEHYLQLVKVVAGKIAVALPAHVDREDLFSSGFFGLIDAIERFDINRNIKFETYAGTRIRGAILDYLRSKDWISVTMRQKIRKYEKTVQKLEVDNGRAPTDQEIADAMEVTLKELAVIEQHASAAASMISIESDGSAAGEAGVFDTSNRDINPMARVEQNAVQETLATAIDMLPEKERIVVTLYYYEELTLKEIGLILHLSEARISQIHSKAVIKMKAYLDKVKYSLV